MATYDITQLSSAVEFAPATTVYYKMTRFISGTRFVIGWAESGGVCKLQAFDVNTTTGVITALSTPLTISGAVYLYGVEVYDSTHIVALYADSADDGWVLSFNVNAGTGAITTWGTANEFEASRVGPGSMCQVDSNHYLLAWSNVGGQGRCRIAELNTSTGDFTMKSSEYGFSSGNQTYGFSLTKIDSTKVLVAYSQEFSGSNGYYSMVLDVNNSTWAVTSAAPALRFDTTGPSGTSGSCSVIVSTSPMVAVIYYERPSNNYIRQISINTSTWATSTLGTEVSIAGAKYNLLTTQGLQKIKDGSFILFFEGSANDGYVRTYTINTGTGTLTQEDEIEFDTTLGQYMGSAKLSDTFYVNSWSGTDNDGFTQAFSVELPSSANSNFLMFM